MRQLAQCPLGGRTANEIGREHYLVVATDFHCSRHVTLSFSLPEALLLLLLPMLPRLRYRTCHGGGSGGGAPLKLITSCHNHVKAHDYQPVRLAFPISIVTNKKVLNVTWTDPSKASFSPESHSPFARGEANSGTGVDPKSI